MQIAVNEIIYFNAEPNLMISYSEILVLYTCSIGKVQSNVSYAICFLINRILYFMHSNIKFCLKRVSYSQYWENEP